MSRVARGLRVKKGQISIQRTKAPNFSVVRLGQSDQFLEGVPKAINSWWWPYWIVSKWPPLKTKESALCHVFWSTWDIWDILVFLMSVKYIKKSNFRHITCCKSHFSKRQFMKVFYWNHSWMHIIRRIAYHLLPWLPHWTSKTANHGMCDWKCHH